MAQRAVDFSRTDIKFDSTAYTWDATFIDYGKELNVDVLLTQYKTGNVNITCEINSSVEVTEYITKNVEI